MKKGVDYTGVTIIFLCHDGQGNFLFAKRSTNCRDEHGRWDCGGGGLDFGETVDQTIRKEIKEEYGADVLSHRFLGYRDVHREHEGSPTHWIALHFLVHIDASQVKNCEPHKFDDLQWFPHEQWPEPLHSQLPYFFDEFGEKIHPQNPLFS